MTTIIEIDWADAARVVEARGFTKGKMVADDGRVCLTGALKLCDWEPGDWLIARAVARHRGHGETWNDHDDRTENDVVDWLNSAAPVEGDELEEVFGPQWEQIVALVRRAAILTTGEADALCSAAGATVVDAAMQIAEDAARNAARNAARTAARYTTWDAARVAAQEAASHPPGTSPWMMPGTLPWMPYGTLPWIPHGSPPRMPHGTSPSRCPAVI